MLHNVALVDTLCCTVAITYGVGIEAHSNLLLDTVEGTTADEQYVRGIDLNILLVWVFTASLRWYVYHRALKNLEQGLLYTLTRNIAGDGWVVALASNLVDLVDEDDASLGSLHIVVCGLQ